MMGQAHLIKIGMNSIYFHDFRRQNYPVGGDHDAHGNLCIQPGFHWGGSYQYCLTLHSKVPQINAIGNAMWCKQNVR